MERISSVLPFQDSTGKMSFRTMFSYIFDYGILIALAIAYAALDKLVTPFAQPFSKDDITIQYPYATNERIPIAEAVAISGGFPLLVIILYTLVIDGIFSHSKQKGFKKYTFRQRLWELNCGALGLLLAQGSAFCITGTLKNLIGRPRPDLLDRCQLNPAKVAAMAPYTLSTRDMCTRDNAYMMQDGFRSFPSGHSSSSFAGLGYLSLYLAGKLHVLDQRGEVWRTVIVVVPFVAASCIAASRIMDARHHAFDVLFGSLLGVVCGYASYRQYFPPLTDIWAKGRAYKMREWGVPIAKTEDDYASGFSSARAARPGEGMARHGAAQELDYRSQYAPQRPEEHQMYGVGSSRQAYQSDLRSPGFENASGPHSPNDETDYEVVRPKAQPPSSTIGIVQTSPGGTNVFRNQVHRNQNLRQPGEAPSDDEEDLGAGRRGLLVGPGKA